MARVTLAPGIAGVTLVGLLETAPSSFAIIIVPDMVLVLKDCVHVKMDSAVTIAVCFHASTRVQGMGPATTARVRATTYGLAMTARCMQVIYLNALRTAQAGERA